MLNQFYTLQKVTQKLKDLVGFKIVEVVTQDKDSAVFAFFDNVEFHFLRFISTPNFECIFLTNNFKNKRSKQTNLFPEIINEIVQDVELIGNSRIIQFSLMKYNIFFQLFGGGNNNVIITNKNLLINNALNNAKELVGNIFEYVNPNLFDLNHLPPETTIKKALSNSQLMLHSYYAQEFIKKNNLNFNYNVKDFSTEEFNLILKNTKDFVNQIQNSNIGYIIQNQEGDLIFSLIPLNTVGKIIEKSEDLFDLIQKVLIFRFKQNKFKTLFRKLEKILNDDYKQFKRQYNSILSDKLKEELAIKYRNYGDLIYSFSVNLKEKGQSEIAITDFEGIKQVIPLSTKMTLIENAENYYKKAKNLNKRLSINDLRKEKVINQYKLAEKRLKELTECKTLFELTNFYKKESAYFKLKMAKEEKEISERFKKFVLSENAVVYVGKDAKNNDELTFGFGKANDYWFHIRGASGSHCILKYNGPGLPSKQIIEQSASIAAYFSSQRNGKFVPVAYTQKKYVRKPKGANIGAVVISKEEVVLVEPKIPTEIED
jgi:predicted ribosome quality control (RQC) complex YloA/Tae2 family protein